MSLFLIVSQSLVQSGRRLVSESKVRPTIMDHDTTKSVPGAILAKVKQMAKSHKPHSQFCFLFNDLILLCEESVSDEHPFVFKEAVSLANCKVERTDKKTLLVTGPARVWHLRMSTSAPCEEWMKAFPAKSN